jgi:hypothetical protein
LHSVPVSDWSSRIDCDRHPSLWTVFARRRICDGTLRVPRYVLTQVWRGMRQQLWTFIACTVATAGHTIQSMLGRQTTLKLQLKTDFFILQYVIRYKSLCGPREYKSLRWNAMAAFKVAASGHFRESRCVRAFWHRALGSPAQRYVAATADTAFRQGAS